VNAHSSNLDSYAQSTALTLTESSHSYSTEALTPVLSSAECGECSECWPAATFKFNRPQAGRPAEQTTRSLTLGSLAAAAQPWLSDWPAVGLSDASRSDQCHWLTVRRHWEWGTATGTGIHVKTQTLCITYAVKSLHY